MKLKLNPHLTHYNPMFPFQCFPCNCSKTLANIELTLYGKMSQKGQTHYENIAAFAARFARCV